MEEVEGVDYVICKICDFKGKHLDTHLPRKHGITSKIYKEKFKGETVCQVTRQIRIKSCKENCYDYFYSPKKFENMEERRKQKLVEDVKDLPKDKICKRCGKLFTPHLYSKQKLYCESCKVNILPCECGCGQIPKTVGSKYCLGHHMKTKKHKERHTKVWEEKVENGWVNERKGKQRTFSEQTLKKYENTYDRKKKNGWKHPKWTKERRDRQKVTVDLKRKNGWNYPKEAVEKIKRTKAKKTPEQRREWIRKSAVTPCIRPNYRERQLIELFEKNDLPYIYVGDQSVWINDKNPDFIHNEKKKIIEFFGERWHEPEDEPIRIKVFSEVGYETLVIWGKELKDISKVLEKIKEFDSS